MTLNFTIFVQICNFWIVCLLLKHLLFKPAVKLLQQEQWAKETLGKKITNQQKVVTKTLAYKEETWKKYQQVFKKSCPQVTTKLFELEEKKEIEPANIPEGDIKEISASIQKVLVKRIEHVH